MHHEADIGFVDAHAKGDGRDDDFQIIPQEGILHPGAFLSWQTGMVTGGADLPTTEKPGHLLSPVTAGTIDDAAHPLLLCQKSGQLLIGLVLFNDRIANIGAIKTGQMDKWLMQTESSQHIVTRSIIRRGRQGNDRYLWEIVLQTSQQGIFWTKIMSPLGDAVGLINGEESQPQFRQPTQEIWQQQAFGSNIEQLQAAITQCRVNAQ